MNKLQLLQKINTLKSEDLQDLRRSLVKHAKTLENCVKQINRYNDEIYDIVRYAEKLRLDLSIIRVGVYEIRKGKTKKYIYHIVSDKNYYFQENINFNWFLINDYELEINKPLKINRFIIDFNYWLMVNAY